MAKFDKLLILIEECCKAQLLNNFILQIKVYIKTNNFIGPIKKKTTGNFTILLSSDKMHTDYWWFECDDDIKNKKKNEILNCIQ